MSKVKVSKAQAAVLERLVGGDRIHFSIAPGGRGHATYHLNSDVVNIGTFRSLKAKRLVRETATTVSGGQYTITDTGRAIVQAAQVEEG